MGFKLTKPKSGSGTPTPKKGEAILLLVKEILKMPTIAADGVSYEGSVIMKQDSTFSSIYMTPTTQDAAYDSSGDTDGMGRKNKFIGMYPGTDKEFMKFLKENLDEEFIIMYGPCESTEKKVMGTPCNPMKLKVSGVDNKDGNKNTLTFEEEIISNMGIMFYNGSITFFAPRTSSEALALDKDTGLIVQLNSAAITAAVVVTGTDLEDGTTVTLIGGGGIAPLTLDNQLTEPIVLLKNATTWVASKDAAIDFRVVKSDKIYLVEISRR